MCWSLFSLTMRCLPVPELESSESTYTPERLINGLNGMGATIRAVFFNVNVFYHTSSSASKFLRCARLKQNTHVRIKNHKRERERRRLYHFEEGRKPICGRNSLKTPRTKPKLSLCGYPQNRQQVKYTNIVYSEKISRLDL